MTVCPPVSVSTVRVSLTVMTAQRTDCGPCCWWTSWIAGMMRELVGCRWLSGILESIFPPVAPWHVKMKGLFLPHTPSPELAAMRLLSCLLILACLVVVAPVAAAEKKISFSRHIKPILAGKCYACHGPDEAERKGEFRLDVREVALEKKVFKPGNAKESEIILRVTSTDPEMKMPPATSKKPALTEQEIELIRKWIDQGAEYDKHWSYLKPVRAAVPSVKDATWPAGDIDRFLLAGMDEAGLKPSPIADKRTLLRRLSFDLTGLPPTPKELADFEADTSAEAYEKVVDRLLSEPQYGERMAMYWLDVVRYADSAGYHSDNHRDVAPFRDYVIAAFNNNKKFDVFTQEQLAGDLFPAATAEQKIASGYNKLLQTTEEGGAQPKEYTAKYAADRVRNTSVIWLAGTMGCCECHSHKFDPFTHKDFYSFAAFFADISEKPVGRQDQTKLPTPDQAAQIKALDEELAAAKAEFAIKTRELTAAREKWEAVAREMPPKGLPAPILAALKEEVAKRTPKQEDLLDAEFRKQAPELAAEREKVAGLEKERAKLDATMLSTLVSISMPPRTMRILPRGNWLDDSGEVVSPAIPAFLSKLPPSENRLSRLDLAHW